MWTSFGDGPPDLKVVEGTRITLAGREALAAQIGCEPEDDDVTGTLRALGILDVDAAHPRGVPALTFAEAIQLNLRKKGIRGFAFG